MIDIKNIWLHLRNAHIYYDIVAGDARQQRSNLIKHRLHDIQFLPLSFVVHSCLFECCKRETAIQDSIFKRLQIKSLVTQKQIHIYKYLCTHFALASLFPSWCMFVVLCKKIKLNAVRNGDFIGQGIFSICLFNYFQCFCDYLHRIQRRISWESLMTMNVYEKIVFRNALNCTVEHSIFVVFCNLCGSCFTLCAYTFNRNVATWTQMDMRSSEGTQFRSNYCWVRCTKMITKRNFGLVHSILLAKL